MAFLVVVTGCRTAPQNLFTADGSSWHVQQGQALWRPRSGMTEIGGDLVLASDETGRCLIQFDKASMELFSAQSTSNRWLVAFPQGQLRFSGHGSGSPRFSWLYLRAALAGKPLPKPLRFERTRDGGWRLENSFTGETLEGFLSP